FRAALSRARVPECAGAGHELLRGLREPARGADAARFLAPGEPGSLRPVTPGLDGLRRRSVVDRRAPSRRAAHAPVEPGHDWRAGPGGPPLDGGGPRRLPGARVHPLHASYSWTTSR